MERQRIVKRVALIVGLTLSCLLLAVAVLHWQASHSSDQFGETVARKIEPGMKHSDVVELLGRKPGNYAMFETMNLDFGSRFTNEMVWWEDNTTAIGILYDDDDRVIAVRSERRCPIKDKTGWANYLKFKAEEWAEGWFSSPRRGNGRP